MAQWAFGNSVDPGSQLEKASNFFPHAEKGRPDRPTEDKKGR